MEMGCVSNIHILEFWGKVKRSSSENNNVAGERVDALKMKTNVPRRALIILKETLNGIPVQILKDVGYNRNIVSKRFIQLQRSHLKNTSTAICHSREDSHEASKECLFDGTIAIGDHVHTSNWELRTADTTCSLAGFGTYNANQKWTTWTVRLQSDTRFQFAIPVRKKIEWRWLRFQLWSSERRFHEATVLRNYFKMRRYQGCGMGGKLEKWFQQMKPTKSWGKFYKKTVPCFDRKYQIDFHRTGKEFIRLRWNKILSQLEKG